MEALADALTVAGDDAARAIVPDFRGLGMARTLDLARSLGIEIEVEGTGRVVAQYPAPGPTAAPGKCRIVFAEEPQERAVDEQNHRDSLAPAH